MPRRTRLRTVTRLLAALFLLVAAGEALLAPLPLVDPALLTGKLECRGTDCRFTTEPRRLIPDGVPAATLPSDTRLAELAGQWRTKSLLFLAAAARRFPQALLFLSLAFALRRLGGA